MDSLGDVLTVAAAGLGAGFVNGAAGGGSLVSYPLLLATGLPALTANVTNTVGLLTGYAGGALGFRDHLRSQRRRLRELAPVALVGGVAGALLLLVTSESTFEAIVPVLILGACALFGFQPIVRRRVVERRQRRAVEPHGTGRLGAGALVAVFAAAVYGGYFGAGIGVILLAILGLVLDDPLPSVNGIRGVLSLFVNVVAALVFAVGADVDWGVAGVLAATCAVGGYAGARASLRLPDHVLRIVVIVFGLAAVARLVTT
ncbi:MAG TPA: sulfite exporter TauE/SafE family protein [Acidimicrobiales bacterium]|nr:sulfite exporter TauE/SafE family protein [Acidimicrobiales bacterium]